MLKTARKGFTLMELILVIGIMSILAGMMTPMVFASREQAREAKALSELDAIATACRSAYADTNTMNGLTVANLVTSGYLSENKTNPWGYGYALYVNWVDADNDGRPEAGTSVIAATSKTEELTLTSAADALAADLSVVVINM